MPASTKTHGRFALTRPPRDNDELYALVNALWGVTVPRFKVCPEHCAPFDWFSDSFFARQPQTIALGSRGLSGKSFAMSILGLTNAVVWGADVNLLGGSLSQSANLHEHMRAAWEYENSPSYMLEDETNIRIKLSNGSRIRPLTASQKTVRGPHPARLQVDEVDEVDYPILQAAFGQPMPQRNWMGVLIPAQTAMTSTWQYPDGCVITGTMIDTTTGPVPIEKIRVGDRVLTRSGYREVLRTHDNGSKPTVTVTTESGRSVTLTADHEVWTSSGWVEAARLVPGSVVCVQALPVLVPESLNSSVPAQPAQHVPVLQDSAVSGQVVPVLAHSLPDMVDQSSAVVLGGGDDLQMAGVHAHPVPAQMVEGDSGFQGADHQLVDEAVGENHLPSTFTAPDGPVSVPVRAGSEGPEDALFSGFDDEIVAATHRDRVVSVSHNNTLLPTYDLHVQGDHEYFADGILIHNTMMKELRRFEDAGMVTHEWCYRESMNSKDGWLSEEFVQQKKKEIPREMWRVEYELGEPSIGNRAFDTDSVERTFDTTRRLPDPIKFTRTHEEYKIEEYAANEDYVIAADWAQSQDFTVITVWKATRLPMELVYYVRINRRPYPQMISIFNRLQKQYRAEGIHDATGLGGVVKDLIDGNVRNFQMTGRQRDDMLTEYVAAVENDRVRAPRIRSIYDETRYASVEDLYSRGKEYHLPDSVCSAALAWKVAGRRFPEAEPVGLPRMDNWMARAVDNNTQPTTADSSGGLWRVDGDVKSNSDPAVMSFT